MPRYYLNVLHGDRSLVYDEEGDETADLDAMRAHALRVVRDLVARTRLDTVRDWFACTFEITDERGSHVCTIPFSDAYPTARAIE